MDFYLKEHKSSIFYKNKRTNDSTETPLINTIVLKLHNKHSLFLLLKTGVNSSETDGHQVRQNAGVGAGTGWTVHAVKTVGDRNKNQCYPNRRHGNIPQLHSHLTKYIYLSDP